MMKRLSVPEPGIREITYEMAYELACEQLATITDIEAQCQRSGTQYLSTENAVAIKHLNRTYHINLPGGQITLTGTDEAVPITDKILILHYFMTASGTSLSGKMITYKELPAGISYYPTFFKRAINPVINNFKDKPQKLLEIAEQIGGHKADYGDVAITIAAFPCVPLTYVLWLGDSEFGPDGNIMFDSNVSDYLPAEDVTVLCEKTAWKLVKLLKTGGDSSGQR